MAYVDFALLLIQLTDSPHNSVSNPTVFQIRCLSALMATKATHSVVLS